MSREGRIICKISLTKECYPGYIKKINPIRNLMTNFTKICKWLINAEKIIAKTGTSPGVHHRRLGKHTVVESYNRILFSNKNE